MIEMAGATVSVPLIANGDVHSPEDIAKVKSLKGISTQKIIVIININNKKRKKEKKKEEKKKEIQKGNTST
jgi:tRNA-dihydrouridine synthase